MDISLGVGVLAATVLLFSWAFGAHRRPNRAAWVDWPGASMLVCVAFTLMGPVGLGLIARGLMHPVADLSRVTLVEPGIALGLAALAVVLTPALLRPGLRPAGAGRRAVNINAAPDTGELPRAA